MNILRRLIPLCLAAGAGFLTACDPHHPAPFLIPPPPPAVLPSGSGIADLQKKKEPTSVDRLVEKGWGTVRCESDKEGKSWKNFQLEVHNFLSSAINPASADIIGCRDNDPGRMIFRGKVFFAGGRLFDLQSDGQILEAADDSYLEIYIYPKTGRTIDFRLDIDVLNTSVRGQDISLAFKDDKGRVELNGKVKDRIFEGRFIYQNFKTVINNGPFGGVLGSSFIAPACKLINCAIEEEPE